MAVIVNKEDDKNSDLTRRINADLREKMAGNSKTKQHETPDFTEDAEYIKDLKKTGKFGWVWIFLVALALGILIALGFSFNK